MRKYCTKCGSPFDAVGREVICPSCKAQAAEETKRAAVERAKRASWAGTAVPVRISGRASAVIREYGKAHDVSFAAALDALMRTTDYFLTLGTAWDDVVPYRSHRRDKHAMEDTPQDTTDTADTPQDTTDTADTPDTPEDTKTPRAAKSSASKASKAASKTASKGKATSNASKTASKAACKAVRK